ncbi:DUF6541 family protein [Actinomyces ruminis]|uniref:Uncharacterized protein n=1 Tax=Actinomyces ruminis TaxID=1937003 RepID=A0ABX4MAE0_9ACTO|nr:DUF6541 family protein [Actinomyces ruminis]PHP52388.1 hypothetical protein BW737_009495 [Actinomyces ruminis]
MSVLAPWLHSTGYLLCLIGLVFVPGWAVLHALGYRGVLPVAAAPPVTFAGVALLGQVYSWIGVRYTIVSLGIGLILCVLLVLLGARLVLGGIPAVLPEEMSRRRRGTAWMALLVAVATGILICAPILGQWDPDLPAQQIDSVFHYNLAWTITQTGDASLLSGASWSFSLRAIPAYYPLVWHAIVAAVAGPTHIVSVTNTLVVLTPTIWTLGIAALALESFPSSRWAPVVASLTTALLPVFPVYMLAYRQLWPNALGYAVLPGMLALLCRALRMLRATVTAGRRRAVIALFAFSIALLGAIATYPSAVFSVLLTGIPLLYGIVEVAAGFVSRRLGRRRATMFLLAFGIILALMVSGLLILEPGVMARLGREGYAGVSNLSRRLWALLTLWPLGAGGFGYRVALVLQLLFTAAGLAITVRHRRWRWIAWAWLLPMSLLVAAYLPLGPLTALTGLWYNDPYRIFPLVLPAICLLAAATVESVAVAITRHASARHRRAAAEVTAAACAVILLVGGVGANSARRSVSETSYTAGTNALVRTLTVDEVQMIRSLRGQADPSLMVLGDPAAGAAYVEVLAGLRSVFPHMTFRSLDWDAQYLAQHFSDIGEDPTVCELVRHYRVGYYYADDAGTVPGVDIAERAPGLYGVDTSTGFELVARGDTASVWRITACGDMDSPGRDPWGLNTPFEPVYGPDGETNVFDDEGRLILEPKSRFVGGALAK